MFNNTWIEDAYSSAVTGTLAVVSILIFAQAGYLFSLGLGIGFTIVTTYTTIVAFFKKKDSGE